MRAKISPLFLLLAITIDCLCYAVVLRPLTARDSPISHIFEFAKGTWVENLAVRSNGKVLVTLGTSPELYQIDPFSDPAEATLVYRFPDAKALGGIAEVEHDVFAVISYNASLTTNGGAQFVWKADLRQSTPSFQKITEVQGAQLLNGMTLLSNSPEKVLISDSGTGVVWLLDIEHGEYKVVLADDTMKPPVNAPLPIGINGVRTHNGCLYYTNSFKELFCRIPIDPFTGVATGAVQIIATGVSGDDFALDQDGTAYIAGNAVNSLIKVTPDGKVTVIAGSLNSTALAGPSSAQFGRAPFDLRSLYVTTGGALLSPVNGVFTEGGRLDKFYVPI